MRSGRAEGVPYSLSRWTDVPAAKWSWFLDAVQTGEMIAFDQRTGVPAHWSLAPEDTQALVWWTKNPRNLLDYRNLITPYRNVFNITVTGWEEVEKGAPSLQYGMELLLETAISYGPENVVWRFSPVPILPRKDVVERFKHIAKPALSVGISSVFVSFVQTNDLMTEPRTNLDKLWTLMAMADAAPDTRILLCNDDASALTGEHVPHSVVPDHLRAGICVAPGVVGLEAAAVDGCGCVMMADPFTINESCTMGCRYCYAADKSLSDAKRNTTRRLPLVK